MSICVQDGIRIKVLDKVKESDQDHRCLIKMYRQIPDGYQIRTLTHGCYHLIRKSDGAVIARMDDLNLLLKRLKNDSFIISIYEHEEWEALETFYSFCYWMTVKGINVLADSRSGSGGETRLPPHLLQID